MSACSCTLFITLPKFPFLPATLPPILKQAPSLKALKQWTHTKRITYTSLKYADSSWYTKKYF